VDWESIYKDLKLRNWIILLVFSAMSFFLMSPAFTFGIIIGGLIIILNFRLFQNTLRRAFSSDGVMEGKKISIILKYFFRLLALGIILFILITRVRVDPVGLAIGLSTVVISIVSLGINRAWKAYTREAT
jgi:hypothetical protein